MYDLIGHRLLIISELCIPLCIGIAVLRYLVGRDTKLLMLLKRLLPES
jgi:hypothetical protein